MIAKNMESLVENNSTIREMFEEGKRLERIYGKENVYDYSLGNPSVKVPDEFNETIKEIVDSKDIDTIHGYMSNSGFEDVRKSIASSINNRFNMDFDENNMIWLEKDASAEIKVTWRCVGSLTENEFSLDYPKK